MAANKKAAAQPTSSDESKPSEDVVVEAALEENTKPAEAQSAQSTTTDKADKAEKTEPDEAESKSVSVTDLSSPNVYPTAFYAGNGIAHCSVCGEADRNDGEGNPICIEHRSDCPRKNAPKRRA